MKFATALLVFLLCTLFGQAQNPKIDSINRLIRQATTDTARINRLNYKIGVMSEINLDSAFRLSLETIQDAQKIRYASGEARARIQLAYCYNFKGNFKAAHQNLNLAELIFLRLPDSAQLLKVYNNFGMMYGMQSKYDSSIAFFKKSIVIAEKFGTQKDLSRGYLNIGISYDMLSNRPQALYYQQKSLTLAQKQHDVNQQAYCWVNLANTYKGMGDMKASEQGYYKAIKLARQAGITNVELYAYTNLAAIYTEGEGYSPKKGYTTALKAARLAKQMGDLGIEATSLSRAAVNLARQKKMAEAQQLNRQAMRIADSSQQPLNIHQTYSAMGQILTMQANYKGAIPYFEKSFQVLKDADIYDAQTGEMYAALSTCYEKTGNLSRALATFKKAAAIADSVRGKENIRKATELTMNYAFEKKQQAAQAEQQKQQALASSRQLALLIGMSLLLLLAGVIFYAYRLKQKANISLQAQKDELQATLTQLQLTQTQLIQSEKMASLGELTAGIAHEIQNPLNFVNNFSELSVDMVDELITERKKQEPDEALADDLVNDLSTNLAKITLHGKRASGIVNNMLEHARTTSGEKQLVDLNTLSKDFINLVYQGVRAKDKLFTCELITQLETDLPKVAGVPQELGRVLVNLLNNAFYAVKQKQGIENYQPQVAISTHYKKGQVEVRIRDNGTGIPDAVVTKVFQPFFTTKPAGQGTGLGLSLSYDIITKGHAGSLLVNTTPGEFTEFVVSLPVAD